MDGTRVLCRAEKRTVRNRKKKKKKRKKKEVIQNVHPVLSMRGAE